MAVEVDERVLAYIAGFFDGEGYVGVIKQGGRFGLRASLTQKGSPPLFELLKRRWGGSIHLYKPTGCSDWVVHGDCACTFLKSILPYLQFKRAQAELAIRYQEQRPKGVWLGLTDIQYRWQEDIAIALKALKHA